MSRGAGKIRRRESAKVTVSSGSCDFAGSRSRWSVPPAVPRLRPRRPQKSSRRLASSFTTAWSPSSFTFYTTDRRSRHRATTWTISRIGARHTAPSCHEPAQTYRPAVASTPSPPCLSQSPSLSPPLPTLAPSDLPRSALSHLAMRMLHPSRPSSPSPTVT